MIRGCAPFSVIFVKARLKFCLTVSSLEPRMCARLARRPCVLSAAIRWISSAIAGSRPKSRHHSISTSNDKKRAIPEAPEKINRWYGLFKQSAINLAMAWAIVAVLSMRVSASSSSKNNWTGCLSNPTCTCIPGGGVSWLRYTSMHRFTRTFLSHGRNRRLASKCVLVFS